jgi:hypothetical protein
MGSSAKKKREKKKDFQVRKISPSFHAMHTLTFHRSRN